MTLVAALAAVLGLATACSAPPLASPQTLEGHLQVPAEFRKLLTFDDTLRVDVLGHPELSTGLEGRRVDYDGNLDLPLLGPVAVAGLTVTEAREALLDRAGDFVVRPSLAVSVVTYAPRQFFVLGEVKASGAYGLERPIHAIQALSQAGGLNPDADGEQVALLRVRGDQLQVHLFNADTPDATGLAYVEPGDLIFVRASGAGSFRQELMPYLQGAAPPIAAIASAFVVADTIGD